MLRERVGGKRRTYPGESEVDEAEAPGGEESGAG